MPQAQTEYNKAYRASNLEKLRAYDKARRNAPGRTYEDRKAYYRDKYSTMPANEKAELLAKNARYREGVKRQVMEAHGGAFCACCGEDRIEFLSINHIYGGGNQERKQLGNARGGYAFYLRLKKKPDPAKYNVLCHNCNLALGFYGYCPHKGV